MNLVSEVAQGRKSSDTEALKNYLSGIYFNAGFQRLIWAAERSVILFGAVTCKCGCLPTIKKTKKGRWPPFDSKARPDAKTRLASCSFNSKLSFFGDMLSQFVEWDNRSYCRKKAFSILADQINPKKHSVYDFEQVKNSRPLMPNKLPWTPIDQMSLVLGAFELACKAYGELLGWNPGASLH